uniref:Uncharacterized protein n=1 Tax=Ananas comosus var. bracteatus TaxID=296719 RepID=A0A6V7PE67_ANACO|nr:unnamed protein product [Ananas comosus var. bracteatus]
MERYRITPSFNNGSSLSSPRPHFNSNSPFYLSVPPNPPPPRRRPRATPRRRRAEHLRRRALLQRQRRRPQLGPEARRGGRRRRRRASPALERCGLSANPRGSSVSSSVDGYGRSSRIGPYATPTASSEASWNSRSGLLANPPGAVAVKEKRDHEERSGGGGDNEGEDNPGNWAKATPFSPRRSRRLSRLRWAEESVRGAGAFSFPVLGAPPTTCSIDDPPRDSLEVFRPAEEEAAAVVAALRKSAELHKKSAEADEVGSDASSDLFEIESFSTSCAAYRRRDSLDDEPRRPGGLGAGFRKSMEESAPSEWGYAPSEASVEWSVATAEGFDRASVANFSSAASEFDEFRFLQAEHDRFAAAVSGAAAAASSKKKGTAAAGGACS